MRSLTNVMLKNAKRRDRKNNNKEGLLTGISFIIVFCFLATIMGIASYYVTIKLSEFEQTYAFVNILLLMNFLLLFTKSIFESLNVLYFSKDLKILLRMPIKPVDILHSKLLSMITSEYEMEIIMLAIPMIVYGIFTNVSTMFYIYMVVILIILPVIPILITSLIISIIMRFTNIIKNKNKVMYITIIIAILIVGLITGGFNNQADLSTSNFENVVLQTNGLAQNIADTFVLIKPIMNTLLNYDNIDGLKSIIMYIAESLICYIIILVIMSKIYLKGAIGTIINSNKKLNIDNKKITLKDLKRKNKYKSYITKELKIFTRTPIFLIQCIIMPIVYPIIVFLIMLFFVNFAKKIGIDVLAEFYEKLTKTSGQAIFLSIGQVFYMMNFSSIIGISKDRKNSILVKYIPIDLQKQFNLKTLVGVYINGITSVLVTICYYFCMNNVFFTLVVFINLILINIIGEKFKLLIDLRNPRIAWDNEYTMMKQNTNVMYELFYTLLIIGILTILSMGIRNIPVFLIFVLVICTIVNNLINKYVLKKKYFIFKKVF